MKINQLIQTSLRLLLILSLSTLTACDAQENAKSAHMTGGSLVGINYTGETIQHFRVDNAGGGGVGRYGTSGDVCCAMYPKKWTPELRVTVKWERTDGREADGKRWKLKTVEKTIPIEKYTELGEVYVTFLPNDEIRVYVFRGQVGGPEFPLGDPHDPDENARTNPSVENSKPYDPILNRGNR